MSLGSGYDIVFLLPRDDAELRPEPLPPQPVRGRRLGHHAGGAQHGRHRSRISDPAAEARTRPALPPHIPHQIAHSSSPHCARGRSCGASSSTPRAVRGAARPPVPPRSKGKAQPPPPFRKGDPRALTSQFPPASPSKPKATAGGPAAMPLVLPYGLKNAAASYASSVSTSLSAYADLPGHHLRSTLDLIATPSVSSYPEEASSREDAWVGADFSGLGDSKTFMRFLEASNYCLGYSDSDGDDYDPSRECFNIEVDGASLNDQGGAGPSER